jgi:hypothetical protein
MTDYIVKADVRPRPTPNIPLWPSIEPVLPIGYRFASTSSSTDEDVTFVQLPADKKSYWVPLIYQGKTYVAEEVSTPPPSGGSEIESATVKFKDGHSETLYPAA